MKAVIRRALIRSAGAIMLLVGSTAWAQNCRLSLSAPEVDYGRLYRAALLDEQPNQSDLSLGVRSLSLMVNCRKPVRMSLLFNAPTAGHQVFRFDRSGHFSVSISQAALDGQSAMLAQVHDPSGTAATGQKFSAQQGIVAVIGGSEVKARLFTARIDIETRLPAQATRVTQETELEGGGAFELLSDE